MTNPLREAVKRYGPWRETVGWLRGSLWTKSVEMLWMKNVFFMGKKSPRENILDTVHEAEPVYEFATVEFTR